MGKQNFQTIDEYIETFPATQQKLLKKMRSIIKKVAPKATEVISYQMPTLKLNGNLVHFAAYKNHIGFYPTPSGLEAFKDKLKPYKTSKGAIQFPLDESLPEQLIMDMVRFRVAENSVKDKSTSIQKNHLWKEELKKLQSIIGETTLVETIKWGIPTYTYNGKNILGIVGFKNHFTLWFYNGSFLTDKYNVLVNAQEGKTKGMRQWRFISMEEIDKEKILEYIKEAIKNSDEGKEIRPDKFKPVAIPELLAHTLSKNKKLKTAFEKLTPGKRKEYIVYIDEAKQEATKLKRLEKIIPTILEGVGLHDKYK